MARCLQLAENGQGTTRPNPMVGSVIVHDNKIISEGWHHSPGTPHAEVHAINNCDHQLLHKSTLYVNLEPCNHEGRTGACAPLIVASGIKKVIIGSGDTHDKVNGSGIDYLKNNGVEVLVGVLTNECRTLNKRFFTVHERKRPYVILKWAQTKNGMIAPLAKTELRPIWITNAYARQHTHILRSAEHAILVGRNTWHQDTPKLSAYRWNEHNPKVVVLSGEKPEREDVIWLNSKTHNSAEKVVNKLHEGDIQSVIIEGGAKTLQGFIDRELWDECYCYESQATWPQGLAGPKVKVTLEPIASFKDNILYHGYNEL